MRELKTGLTFWFLLFLSSTRAAPSTADTTAPVVQLVYTSDVHFGITRHHFEGDSEVDAGIVNARMVEKINTLPGILLPQDQGVHAGQPVGPIDYLMESGDIANRQEAPIQSATRSWEQFDQVYLHGLTLKNSRGGPTGFLLTPGNHDVSNAIGYYKKMQPATDPAGMVAIYNYMLHPATAKTGASFHYPADKINYARDIGGIHFLFINIWPDSANRIWMEKELNQIDARTPVIIVAHDPPEGDAAHFINPNGAHDINAKDKFENLLEEWSKDRQDTAGSPAPDPLIPEGKPRIDLAEQAGFAAFLKAHPNIRAYFHGHNNWNEFYTYTGPAHDLALPVFRVDSPMKGRFSGKQETLLSFQLITIDTRTKTMTVRECRWNTDPAHPETKVAWGDSRTIAL